MRDDMVFPLDARAIFIVLYSPFGYAGLVNSGTCLLLILVPERTVNNILKFQIDGLLP